MDTANKKFKTHSAVLIEASEADVFEKQIENAYRFVDEEATKDNAVILTSQLTFTTIGTGHDGVTIKTALLVVHRMSREDVERMQAAQRFGVQPPQGGNGGFRRG